MKRATSSPSQGRKKLVVSQRRAAGRTIDPTPRVIARKNAKDSPQDSRRTRKGTATGTITPMSARNARQVGRAIGPS